MASKSSQPALYEKMRTRNGSEPAHTPLAEIKLPEPPRISPSDIAGSWLRPGNIVRLPVGYVLLAAVMVIVLSAVAYMVGHNRGKTLERLKYEKSVTAAAAPSDALQVVDSLYEQPAKPSAGIASGPKSPQRPAGGSDAVAKRSPGAWGSPEPTVDPRKKGLNYFVLAETTQSGAVRLVEYCRSQGLETYVVSGKNARLRRVVAFPGFSSSARSSAEVKGLETFIHTVGDRWKRTQRGDSDLSDAYPSLYSG